MTFDLNHGLAVLERTPTVLRELLDGLPDDWVRGDEGPDTWSPFDVVGHLIDGEEEDWVTRARIILDQGESVEFEPFDRFRHLERNVGRTLTELLDEFERLRMGNLNDLRVLDLSEEQLELRGVHPEFGSVTLGQLLATWVVHDMTHLAQISRVMAKQYDEAVGPWKAYLTVLNS